MHTDTIFSLNIIKTQLEIFLNTWHNILRESINISVLKSVMKLVIYEEMCLIKKSIENVFFEIINFVSELYIFISTKKLFSIIYGLNFSLINE